MIRRMGTGASGAPLVIMELDAGERVVMARLLRLAESHTDEIRASRWALSRRERVKMLIGQLREANQLPHPSEPAR